MIGKGIVETRAKTADKAPIIPIVATLEVRDREEEDDCLFIMRNMECSGELISF